MKKYLIRDLFEIIGGKPSPQGENCFSKYGTPFVKMKDLGKVHFSNNFNEFENYVSEEVAQINRLTIIKKGAILLPRSGSVALNHRAVLGVDAYIVSHICALQVKDPRVVYNIYAYYYLRSINMVNITKKTTGLDAITFEDLGKIKIPLHSLDDQIRIATLLSKVENLISRRREQLKQLDELLKSVFLEMFGDPVRNEMGWDFSILSQFGKISTGNTPPRLESENYNPPFIEWIKTDNIPLNSVFLTKATESLSESGIKKGRTVEKGALLVACIAGSVKSIGRACISDRTVAFNQQINALQPNETVNPLFLYMLFKISQTYIQSKATKGMKKILIKGDFEKIKMIKPPLEIQNNFTMIFEKIERIKAYYQQSLVELENLYSVLNQKVFKGELDLSWVSLAEEVSSVS